MPSSQTWYRLQGSSPEAEVSTYSTAFDGRQDFSNTLYQLREYLVFALEFLLQSFNFLLIPIRNSGAGLLAFKSGCSVLEKLSLPLVKYRRMDAVLLAQIRNSSAFCRTKPVQYCLLWKRRAVSRCACSFSQFAMT